MPSVQACDRVAQVLFDTLADKLLSSEEFVPDIIYCPAVAVIAVLGNREYLMVVLDDKLQLLFDVPPYLWKYLVKPLLAVAVEDKIIGILLTLQFERFVHPVHKVGEVQVGEVLRQVVAYRQTRRTVYDFVKQPQEVSVLDFPADEPFQHVVAYRRITLADVDFKAVQGLSLVTSYHLPDVACAALYASVLDARVGVVREHGHPYRFEDNHNGVMHDAVGIVRKTEYDTLLGLVDSENLVGRCLERFCQQSLVQSLYVRFTVAVVEADTIAAELPPTGFLVSQSEVLHRDYLFV